MMSAGFAVGPRPAAARTIQCIERFLLQMRESAVQIGKRVGGQNARPATICDNCKAVALNTFDARDHLGQFEHFVQVENAQDARPAQRRAEHLHRRGRAPV